MKEMYITNMDLLDEFEEMFKKLQEEASACGAVAHHDIEIMYFFKDLMGVMEKGLEECRKLRREQNLIGEYRLVNR